MTPPDEVGKSALRARALARRAQVESATRQQASERLVKELDRLDFAASRVVSGYWPIRNDHAAWVHHGMPGQPMQVHSKFNCFMKAVILPDAPRLHVTVFAANKFLQ